MNGYNNRPASRVPRSVPCSARLLPALLGLSLLGAACFLHALGTASAKDSLQSLINDYIVTLSSRDEEGYATQAQALERIADRRTVASQEALHKLLDTYGTADHRRAVLLLRALIRNGAPDDVDAAIKWIERRKEPMLMGLLHEVVSAAQLPRTREYIYADALRSATPRVRVQIIRGLGFAGDRAPITALLRLLREEDRDVRVETLEALGRLKAIRALPLMQVFLRDAASELRDAAARGLGLLASAKALPALSRALEDAEPLVVESAAQALGRIGDPQAVPCLIEGLGRYVDENLRLVDAFAQALYAISGKAIGTDPELWSAWWNTVKDKPFARAGEVGVSTTDSGPTYYGFPVRSSRVVFVLDVSRSMGWNQRLDSAKAEIIKVLKGLPSSTFFNLLIFSDRAAHWKGTADLKPAKSGLIREAIRYIDSRRPRNGTNTHEALMKALDAPRADTVFFLSDGHPSVGTVQDPKMILNEVRRRNQYRRVRIHCIALLRGEPPQAYRSLEDPDRSLAFMELLAKQNNGRFKKVE